MIQEPFFEVIRENQKPKIRGSTHEYCAVNGSLMEATAGEAVVGLC